MPGQALRNTINLVDDLLSRLRLDHDARKRGAIVVEGTTDEVVLSRAFAIDVRSVFPVAGRSNVLRVARALRKAPLAGVICVADRDYDPTAEWERQRDVLVYYDCADLEAMLVSTQVFDRFLSEWGSASKLATAGGPDGVRARIVKTLSPVAALRAANALHGWGLVLDAVPLAQLVDKQTLALSRPRLVARLTQRVPELRAEVEDALLEEPPSCPATRMRLIRGRDATAVTEVALRRLIGSLSQQQVANDFAARTIRRMVGKDDLAETPFAERFSKARETFAQR